MRIAHVINYFQPEFGYHEYYVPREQAAKGHEVHLITSDRIFPFHDVANMLADIGSPYRDRMRPVGVSEKDGFTVHRNPARFETLYDFIVYEGVKETLRRIKPDVVHAHGVWPWGSRQAASLKGELKFKLVLDEHAYATTYDLKRTFRNWLLDREYRTIRAPIGRYTVKRADRIVGVSQEATDFVKAFYKVPVTTIPLGIDHRLFVPDPEARRRVRKDLGLGDEFVIVTAGRMDKAKKLELFIEALKKVPDRDVRLIVVGRGDQEYLDALKRAADERVTFLGFRTPQELSALYSASDLGVWGKASITIREAMGCGLPLLLFDSADMRSLLRWGNGTSVRMDAGAISDEIVRLRSDPGGLKEMSRNSRLAVERELSAEVEASRLLSEYEG
jgi:glycosyltransferase involved in cell wall biosynthesis